MESGFSSTFSNAARSKSVFSASRSRMSVTRSPSGMVTVFLTRLAGSTRTLSASAAVISFCSS